jgi:hypothetical protein
MSALPKSETLAEVIEEMQKQPAAEKGDGWREEAIRARVLAALGRPAGLLKVSVRPLWGDHFRVNVWTGSSDGATIPDSYFVTADKQGVITKSEPPIENRY